MRGQKLPNKIKNNDSIAKSRGKKGWRIKFTLAELRATGRFTDSQMLEEE